MNQLLKALTVILFPAAITACGGGSDSDAPTSPPVIGQNGSVKVNTVSMSSDQTCEISNFAPAMLDAINKARSQARDCGGKAYGAAPAVGWNSLLTQAAVTHATDMASTGKVSETSSTGENLTDRVTLTGYEYAAVGENVAKGYTSVPKLLESLLSSGDHCQKIMSPVVTEVGAGCVKSATGTNYWAQTFGVHKSVN